MGQEASVEGAQAGRELAAPGPVAQEAGQARPFFSQGGDGGDGPGAADDLGRSAQRLVRSGRGDVRLAGQMEAGQRPPGGLRMAHRGEGRPRPRLAVEVVPVEQLQYLVDEVVLRPRRTGTVVEGPRHGHPLGRQVLHKGVLGLQAGPRPHRPVVTLDHEPERLAATGAGHRNDSRSGERAWAVPGDTGGGSVLQADQARQ